MHSKALHDILRSKRNTRHDAVAGTKGASRAKEADNWSSNNYDWCHDEPVSEEYNNTQGECNGFIDNARHRDTLNKT